MVKIGALEPDFILKKSYVLLLIWQLGLQCFIPINTKTVLKLSSGRDPVTDRVNVITQHNDNGRTGANLKETTLNAANVNVRQFGKLFSRPVEGQIYAQPLYVSQIEIPGKGPRNVVYVATEGNYVYAFDADDPTAFNPYWRVYLGKPVPSTDISPTYRDLTPDIGITSTPVIDLESQTIYVVAKSKDTTTSTYAQNLHALDLATGQEKPNSPVEITATVSGTGTGNLNGVIRLDPLLNLNRPGLLLLNGTVYLAFGSHGGKEPYHGWVLGYDAKTLEQLTVFNTTPDGGEGSIWQSGQGLAADADGYIYLITGNGTFNAKNGGRNFGDSAIRFSTENGLEVVDYYTPFNEEVLYAIDADLGAGGPVLLPGFNRLIFTGKDTVLRVLDTKDLGRFHPQIDQIVQRFQPSTRRLLGAPVYWDSPNNGPVIYYCAAGDFLKVFQFANGRFQEFATQQSSIRSVQGISNAPPLSISADGKKAGTGILWMTSSVEGDSNQEIVSGIVRAFDANDISRELWNSQENIERDGIGRFAKFCPPTVANGKVYVPTFSDQLEVFGLLPGVCAYSLSQTERLVESGTSAGNVALKAEDKCGWLVISNEDWITVTSNQEEIGEGTVSFTINANPTSEMRTGTISIAGQSFTIRQAGVASSVSAASFEDSGLANESIVSVFGTGLAASTEFATTSLPTTLGGAAMVIRDFDGVERPAPLFFVSPTQINYLIPSGTALGGALVSITSANGNFATGKIQIESVSPGLFSANSNGQGVAAAVALRVASDNTQTYESILQPDSATNKFVPRPIDLSKANDQVYLLLFGTGIRFRSSLELVRVKIADLDLPVSFAGEQGDFIGLDQINLLLPRTLDGRGEMDLVLTVDGKSANRVKIHAK